MTRSKTRHLVIALIFAIFMTGFFWISANADPASAVSVTVQAENPNGGFILPPTTINVSAGRANTISGGTYYNDSPATNSDVTVLDVLFAAHEYLYNDFDDTTYSSYIDGDAPSYITEMFGIPAGSGYSFPSIMFAVNGIQPRDNDPNHSFPAWGSNGQPSTGYMTYAMNQAIVPSNAVVNFFFVKSYHDIYTFLDDGYDDYLGFNPLTQTFTTSDTLYLKGYDFFTDGWLAQSGWTIYDLENAKICRALDGFQVGTADGDGVVDLSDLSLSIGINCLTIKSADENTLGYYIPIFFIVQN